MSVVKKSAQNARQTLIWQLEAGIDEYIGETPLERFNDNTKKLPQTKSTRSENIQDQQKNITKFHKDSISQIVYTYRERA